jgi:hypothetical protein
MTRVTQTNAGRFHGPVPWTRAVCRSLLKASEKSVCFALANWIDWESGEGYPSTATIAEATGLGVKTVRAALRRLEQRGILEFQARSRGGHCRTHRLKLRLIELQGAARPPRKRNAAAFSSGRGRPSERGHRFEVFCGPGPRPDEASDATEEQTDRDHQDASRANGTQLNRANRTQLNGSNRTQEPPNLNSSIPPTTSIQSAEAGGGGGGACAGLSGIDSQKASVPPGWDPGESRRRLIQFGVTAMAADRLSHSCRPELVERGIRWVKAQGAKSTSPSGLLVHLLRDGTIEELWQKEQADQRAAVQRAAARERHQQRCECLERLVNFTKERCAAHHRSCVDRGWKHVFAVWPTIPAVAEAGIVADADLLAQEADAWALFNALVKAARGELRAATGLPETAAAVPAAPLAAANAVPASYAPSTGGLDNGRL